LGNLSKNYKIELITLMMAPQIVKV